jgi:hypothetical protein
MHKRIQHPRGFERYEHVVNALSTATTAAFTIVLAISTVLLWKETKDLRDFAQDQGADMKASIAEAARSAVAMRDVATAVAENAKAASESVAVFKDSSLRQMRAYLSFSLLGVVNQDRDTNYHLEVRLSLQNMGNTPAYKVLAVRHADVVSFPLPPNFEFTIPSSTKVESSNILGPHQNFIISAIVDRLISDEDLHAVQYGTGKTLLAYGAVAYEDAFGIPRHTNFSQAIMWLKGNQFMGNNTLQHNDAD